MREAMVHTDGGSRGNPGPAALGVVIVDASRREMRALARYLGEMTNNQAEYQALIAALEEARRLGVERISLRLDSELVVRQIQGRYAVRDPGLRALYDVTKGLLGEFQAWEIAHVPRAQNQGADRLVNQILDMALAGPSR